MPSQRFDEQGYGAWNATGVGTNAGVSVTHTLTTGATYAICTGIQYSSDAACVVTVESPSGTPIFKIRHAAAVANQISFPGLKGASSQNILVKVSASTTNSEANIQGYDVN